MASISLLIRQFIYTSLIFLPCLLCANSTYSLPPPPPPPPSPSPDFNLTFEDIRLAVVYPIIQIFKKTITADPFNKTNTWVGSDICNKYEGFFCDIPPDNSSAKALAAIDFNGFQLAAPTLEGFIDQLLDLAIFHANTNNFSGTISPNISNLPYFYELDISNNRFFGEFPQAVLGMNKISFLDIRYNFFTGTVPQQVFMQTLDVLFINNNNFERQLLPQNLGFTSALYLTFANNKFTGPIPRSIGNASSTLLEVLFLNNQLTGCIPYEIGLLQKATVFDAGNNLLTGPLPYSLGCLDSIEQLNFAGNFLYGEVPEVVCLLGNLLNLSLSDNYFTHVGPVCRKLIKKGVLDVRDNCIHGLPDQKSLGECWWFFFYSRFWHCQYPWWLSTYVPCKAYPPLKKAPPVGSKRRLLSYAALGRQRL